jgi:hypothetical protein
MNNYFLTEFILRFQMANTTPERKFINGGTGMIGRNCLNGAECKILRCPLRHDGTAKSTAIACKSGCTKRAQFCGVLSTGEFVWQTMREADGNLLCTNWHDNVPVKKENIKMVLNPNFAVPLEVAEYREPLMPSALAETPVAAPAATPVEASAETPVAAPAATPSEKAWEVERLTMLERIRSLEEQLKSRDELVKVQKELNASLQGQVEALKGRLAERETTKEVAAIPVVAENVVSPNAGKSAGRKFGGRQCFACRDGRECSKPKDGFFHRPSCPKPGSCAWEREFFHGKACGSRPGQQGGAAESTKPHKGKVKGSHKGDHAKASRKKPKAPAKASRKKPKAPVEAPAETTAVASEESRVEDWADYCCPALERVEETIAQLEANEANEGDEGDEGDAEIAVLEAYFTAADAKKAVPESGR